LVQARVQSSTRTQWLITPEKWKHKDKQNMFWVNDQLDAKLRYIKLLLL